MKNPGPQLIVGFKEGRPDAFQLVYKRYHRALYHFVKQLTGDVMEAEDIVAETFVKLWNLKANFETDNNIKAFLYITARNASLNFLRFKKNQDENRKEFVYLNSEAFEPNEIPVDLQLLELIQNTLDELPHRQQEIMRMILCEGLSDEEVAERIHKSPKTVRNLKAVAVNYLRVNLDSKEFATALLLIYFFPN